MSFLIQKIEIRNFRSIANLTLDAKQLTLFVGKNDSGKSNVLRALNLFFNNATDPQTPLDFDRDFNVNGHRSKKADEISVALTFSVPENYVGTNGNVVVWKKAWRRGKPTALKDDDYIGERHTRGARGRLKIAEIEIPAKSNMHEALRRIHFEYIPAIKSSSYFEFLREKIYRTISAAAETSFRDSSRSFEEAIQNQVSELSASLQGALGFDSQLSLPKDLSDLFRKLDFINPTQNISISQRGDGVKVRHIPHILDFIAQKERQLAGRGSPRYTTIWGYEEPENNLEILACINLANEIYQLVGDSVAQSFITTHSPVFYNVNRGHEDRSVVHLVIMNDKKETEKASAAMDVVDSHLGVMPIYAERIQSLQADLQASLENETELRNIVNNSDKPTLFVEGVGDKAILEKAFKVFANIDTGKLIINTKNSGAGHSYVFDMLNHYKYYSKHRTNNIKCAGLVDCDVEGRSREWNQVADNVRASKCFTLPKTRPVQEALQQGFRVTVVLESLYPDSVWRYALGKGWLVELKPTDFMRPDLINQTLADGVADFSSTPLFVRYKFHPDHKNKMANRLAKKMDAEFREIFQELESVVTKIKEYLFPN